MPYPYRENPALQQDCVTMVTCIHPYHGVEVFYFTIEEYQSSFMPTVGTYWANGYTIISQPVER